MRSLENQAIIVTGAAGNLGAAIARVLAGYGARLALCDVRREPLEAAARDAGASNALLIDGADVRTEAGAQRIAEETAAKFGRIDALANTVGTFKMAPVISAAADWDMLMALNALSALRLSAAVLPTMTAQKKGRIVHVAAGAGQRSFAEASVYSASKAAVIRITEAISEEHKANGVGANCVMPGTIDTPQNRAAMPGADTSTWVQPAAIASVVAFLLSAEAEAITGAAIPVTGRG
jgi:NAD(P)-dependent dehydrogenase (short-subunit alcohol dehydrogenase family)